MDPVESCRVSDVLKGNLAWLADIDRMGRHSRRGRSAVSVLIRVHLLPILYPRVLVISFWYRLNPHCNLVFQIRVVFLCGSVCMRCTAPTCGRIWKLQRFSKGFHLNKSCFKKENRKTKLLPTDHPHINGFPVCLPWVLLPVPVSCPPPVQKDGAFSALPPARSVHFWF